MVVCNGKGAQARMPLVATPIQYLLDGNGSGFGECSARSYIGRVLVQDTFMLMIGRFRG